MLNSLFSSTTIPVLEQVVNFSQARHQVLAGNIANLDTPGYRTRDLSPEVFSAHLRRVLADRERASSLPRGGGSSGGSGGAFPAGLSQARLSQVSQGLGALVRHDDVNVGVEQQVTELAKNQMQHNLALSIMTSQFRLLQAAVSERA